MGLKTTLDGLYERESFMYGGGWVSRERGVMDGDVRVINGILSRAWNIARHRWPRKDRVMWTAVDPKELRKVDINERPE